MAQTKLSIDLFLDPEKNLPIGEGTLVAITSGCITTLWRLGNLARFVEVFRVTFCRYEEKKGWGPSIAVYYNNPLGEKTSFTTDFRFLGSGSTTPSAAEIAEVLCDHLPRFMREHLERGSKKLAAAQDAYKQISRTPTKKYPPISRGTVVKTTQPDWDHRNDWTDEGWAGRKWDVEGTVINHHDSHGLCYDVRHPDGTVGCYNPSELKVVPVNA